MSPNSYGLGAPLASMPVDRSRVSCRPALLWPSEPSRSRSALKPRKSSALSVTSKRACLVPSPSPPPWARRWRSASRSGDARDVARLLHPLDDLLDQLLELLAQLLLIAVGRLAEDLLEHLGRQHAAAEERLENGVVQRLHRPIVGIRRIAPGIAEPAREQQVGQLRHQLVHVELVESDGTYFGMLVTSRLLPRPCMPSRCLTSTRQGSYWRHLPSCNTASSSAAARPRRHQA